MVKSMEPALASDIFAADRALEEQILSHLLLAARRGIEAGLRRIRRPEAAVGVCASPLGPLFVAEGPRGLLMVHFMRYGNATDLIAALRRKFDPVEEPRAVDRVGIEIRRHLRGQQGALSRPVDLALVESGFRREAYKRLREVPAGAVVTYSALAEAIGAASAQRAVGNAMASNPIPIYVPCHRVVRSDGSVGNYGGGVQNKVRLLRAEGFAIGGDLRVDGRAVLGHRGSRIFCRPGCAAVTRAAERNFMLFADAAHALGAGMRACRRCHPA